MARIHLNRSNTCVIVSAIAGFLLLIAPVIFLIVGEHIFQGARILGSQCSDVTPFSMSIVTIMGVLFGSRIIGGSAVPHLWGDTWHTFDEVKKRKLIGYFIKITCRIIPACLILFVVLPHFRFDKGLFRNHNMGVAYDRMVDGKHVVTVCGGGWDWPVQMWVVARISVIVVMVWELAYIPELTWDAWMHHGYFVLLGSASLDERFLINLFPATSGSEPYADGFGIFLMMGGSCGFMMEVFVLLYHMDMHNPRRQAIWMMHSSWVQFLNCFLFFIVFPFTVWIVNMETIPLRMAVLAPFLLSILAMTEFYMISVKLSIRRKKLKEAAEARLLPADDCSYKDVQSFSEPRQVLLDIVNREQNESLCGVGSC